MTSLKTKSRYSWYFLLIFCALFGLVTLFVMQRPTTPVVSQPGVARTGAVLASAVPETVNSALSSGAMSRPQEVTERLPRYKQLSEAFKKLGKMYSFHVPAYGKEFARDLILSGIARKQMTQPQAAEYCLGIAARLPTKEELIVLSRALGAVNPDYASGHVDVRGYNAALIFNMSSGAFWSSSVHPDHEDYSFYLNGINGKIYGDSRFYTLSVRCVHSVVTP